MRQRFCNLKEHYRSLCRKSKRKHEQELLGKLDRLHHTDTESFWKLLKQIKGDKKQTLINQHELRPLEKSLNYFKALLQKQTPEFPAKENPNIKNVLGIESLNKSFDAEEIKCGLKKPKQHMTPGVDSLTSEMLKFSNYNLLNELKKRFNLVLDSGFYPDSGY